MDTVDKCKQREWTNANKAATSNYGWAPLFFIHSLLPWFWVPSVSLSGGRWSCAGSLTAQNGNFQKYLTHPREWHLWMSYRCLSVFLRKNIWFQKYLYFLAIIFLHWKTSAILLSILWLCYFAFTHRKWVSKGEESFTCVVNYRWPQTCLWSHKPVFKPHLWDAGQDLCVC